MRAADLQSVLSNTAVVQQIHQQGEHRADNVQHQFVLESHVVLNQKQQTARQPAESRVAEVHRDHNPKHRRNRRESVPSAEGEPDESSLPLEVPGCGQLVDLQA